jgi:hypothetical protein
MHVHRTRRNDRRPLALAVRHIHRDEHAGHEPAVVVRHVDLDFGTERGLLQERRNAGNLRGNRRTQPSAGTDLHRLPDANARENLLGDRHFDSHVLQPPDHEERRLRSHSHADFGIPLADPAGNRRAHGRLIAHLGALRDGGLGQCHLGLRPRERGAGGFGASPLRIEIDTADQPTLGEHLKPRQQRLGFAQRRAGLLHVRAC